jgi:hypothetical protein
VHQDITKVVVTTSPPNPPTEPAATPHCHCITVQRGELSGGGTGGEGSAGAINETALSSLSLVVDLTQHIRLRADADHAETGAGFAEVGPGAGCSACASEREREKGREGE